MGVQGWGTGVKEGVRSRCEGYEARAGGLVQGRISEMRLKMLVNHIRIKLKYSSSPCCNEISAVLALSYYSERYHRRDHFLG